MTDIWAGRHDVRSILNYSGSSILNLVLYYDEAYELDEVRIVCNTAPTTSEDFEISLDAIAGSSYDTPLKTIPMSGVKDYRWIPDKPSLFILGDKINFNWLNTDNRTWGLTIVYRRVR